MHGGTVAGDRSGGFGAARPRGEQFRTGRARQRSAICGVVISVVALVDVFKSAMAGTCNGHEELAASAIPLEVALPVVPARGGEDLVRRLFAPLGYDVEVAAIGLDTAFPDWGDSRYVSLRLAADCRLADLLTHLYVLLPVLDDDKHYWVDEAEIEKLMRRGEGWLATHPERDLIVRRYLKKQAQLFFAALAQLDETAPMVDDVEDTVNSNSRSASRCETSASPPSSRRSRPQVLGGCSISAVVRELCFSGCCGMTMS